MIKGAFFGSYAVFLIAACQHTQGMSDDHATGQPLGWIEGCWNTEDSETLEVWARASSAHLFGYNTLTKDEKVVFFEQMRLEKSGTGWAFAAHPGGAAPTLFAEESRTDTSATFINTENDYPQRIAYRRDGEQLVAEISLIDGSRLNRWTFFRCDKDR